MTTMTTMAMMATMADDLPKTMNMRVPNLAIVGCGITLPERMKWVHGRPICRVAIKADGNWETLQRGMHGEIHLWDLVHMEPLTTWDGCMELLLTTWVLAPQFRAWLTWERNWWMGWLVTSWEELAHMSTARRVGRLNRNEFIVFDWQILTHF